MTYLFVPTENKVEVLDSLVVEQLSVLKRPGFDFRSLTYRIKEFRKLFQCDKNKYPRNKHKQTQDNSNINRGSTIREIGNL